MSMSCGVKTKLEREIVEVKNALRVLESEAVTDKTNIPC